MTKGLGCAVKHSCYRNSKLQTLACVASTKIHRMLGVYGKINYICLTEFNKNELLKLKKISEKRVFIKPNFVDETGAFLPAAQRINQFVFAGRLDKLKGIDILLESWKKMGDEAPQLLIFGTGPMEEWCKDFINQNHIHAKMKGFVKNEEIRQIIAESKALILPTQWYEGFPMSIVEAFSVGTPVICSDLGNAGSIVKEGVSGYKFRHDSVDELIHALNRIEPDIHKKTFSEYNEKYTKEVNYEMLERIYRESM